MPPAGFLRRRGHRLTHFRRAPERDLCVRPRSRCARWLIRHAAMLRAVGRALDAIGAAIVGFCGGTFDWPSAMMALQLVRLHAGCLVFGHEVGGGATGFDMSDAASATFKRVKVR